MRRAEFAKLIGERQPVTLARIEDESGQESDPVWYAIDAETALRYFERFGDRLVIDRTFPSVVRLTAGAGGRTAPGRRVDDGGDRGRPRAPSLGCRLRRNLMLRNIVAAVVGYIAMAAVLFALFSILWVMVGPSRAFEPGSWEVPVGWALVQLVLGLVGAYIGGQVCARVAHDAKGATMLIGLVIVMGVVNALIPPEMAAGARPDDVSMTEATAGDRQPAWFLWLNPVVGFVGVWFGTGRLRARSGKAR